MKKTVFGTVMAVILVTTSLMCGVDAFADATDAKAAANQKLLAQTLVRPDVHIALTEDIYTRRNLSLTEDSSEQVLSWNNLPKNEAGPASTVTICKLIFMVKKGV